MKHKSDKEIHADAFRAYKIKLRMEQHGGGELARGKFLDRKCFDAYKTKREKEYEHGKEECDRAN